MFTCTRWLLLRVTANFAADIQPYIHVHMYSIHIYSRHVTGWSLYTPARRRSYIHTSIHTYGAILVCTCIYMYSSAAAAVRWKWAWKWPTDRTRGTAAIEWMNEWEWMDKEGGFSWSPPRWAPSHILYTAVYIHLLNLMYVQYSK